MSPISLHPQEACDIYEKICIIYAVDLLQSGLTPPKLEAWIPAQEMGLFSLLEHYSLPF